MRSGETALPLSFVSPPLGFADIAEEEILAFIQGSFPSVWAIELALLLKRDGRVWCQQDLVSGLRASEVVVAKTLDALLAAGLASIDEAGARYAPANLDVQRCMERVEELYRTRPNLVRRTIVTASAGSAVAFANAFKIRKNGDD